MYSTLLIYWQKETSLLGSGFEKNELDCDSKANELTCHQIHHPSPALYTPLLFFFFEACFCGETTNENKLNDNNK